MFEFFGFDPKTLTNEELFEKQLALTTKKLIAARVGKVTAVNQLQQMITAIEFERRERMFQDRIGSFMLESSPVVIETDIGLQQQEAPEEETKKPVNKEPQRPIRRAIRTSKPVNPQ